MLTDWGVRYKKTSFSGKFSRAAKIGRSGRERGPWSGGFLEAGAVPKVGDFRPIAAPGKFRHSRRSSPDRARPGQIIAVPENALVESFGQRDLGLPIEQLFGFVNAGPG